MPVQEQDREPQSLHEIKEDIRHDAETTGLVESLAIEGIIVSQQLIHEALEAERHKKDGTTNNNQSNS